MSAPIIDQPLVSDDLLAELVNPDVDAQRGEFDAETRAMLATALREICSELLLWRQTARNRPFALALALRSEAIEARLDDARRTIRAPEPAHARDLTAACETLLRHSTDAAERTAAEFLRYSEFLSDEEIAEKHGRTPDEIAALKVQALEARAT